MSSYLGVVLDVGSQSTKAGFAGEAFPRAVIPSVTARFRHKGLVDGFPTIYYGKEAILYRGLGNLTWPVQEGVIQNWEEMEKLWHHIFYTALHVPPEETKVMHSVHPLISRKDKERMTEILFESFTVEGLYIMKSPVLILHAAGKSTGVVWEGGATSSYAAAVFEGFPLKHTTILSPLTGELLTDRLQALLAESGYSFTTPYERDLLNVIKSKHCYIPTDYAEAIKSNACSGENKISHKLPDSQNILLGEERIQCPEVLFKPSLAGLDYPNITEIVANCINKCDCDYTSTFYENIVLAGGTSMFPGLAERFKMEVSQSVLKKSKPYKVNVEALTSRQNGAWLGGSLMASLDILKGFWMTRDEYEDSGSDRANYKFF